MQHNSFRPLAPIDICLSKKRTDNLFLCICFFVVILVPKIKPKAMYWFSHTWATSNQLVSVESRVLSFQRPVNESPIKVLPHTNCGKHECFALTAATKVHYRWSGRERGNAHGRRGVWGGLAPIPRCGWEPTCFQVRFFKPWFGRRTEEVFSQDVDDAYEG